MDFTNLTDHEVFGLWAGVMRELRRRELIRTWNSPVAEYAEWVVARRLDLQLATNSRAGYDAEADDGTRYQIKARRVTGGLGDRQLGVIRNIDQHGFDYLAVVFFDHDLGLKEMWRLPFALVREKAVYNKHQNGHVLILTPKIIADPGMEWIGQGADPRTLPPQSPAELGVERGGPMTRPQGIDGPQQRNGQTRLDLDRMRKEAASRLHVRFVRSATERHHAVDDDNRRYIFRSRTKGSAGERETGVIRDFDQRWFDYLVFVLFDQATDEYRMWRLPFDLVDEHKKYDRVNGGHVLIATDKVLGDPRAESLQ